MGRAKKPPPTKTASAPDARPPFRPPRRRAPTHPPIVVEANSERGNRASTLERAEAEWAFVREGRTLAEIAQAHGRSYNTVKEWAQAGLWEAARRSFLLSDQGQADILQDQVRKLLMDLQTGERTLTAPLAHTILLASRGAKEMRGDRFSWSQLFAILKDFLREIRAADPSLLGLLEPHVERYLQNRKAELLSGKG